MNASIEAKKAEAVERMKLWGIYPPIIKCFEQEGIVSESAPPLGTCSQLEGEQLERVRKFEEKYNAVVYHVIHSFTNIGELESYLFVSDRPDEWERTVRTSSPGSRSRGSTTTMNPTGRSLGISVFR